MKSERLKKLESELRDLEQWLKLGLVPKKDIERHREEILALQERIVEERDRLQFLKESGEMEEYVTPRRTPGKAAYPDTPSMSDIDVAEESNQLSDVGIDMETEAMDFETTIEEDKEEFSGEEGVEEEEEDEDPFSDRNRWRRGVLDPEANDW
jgi:hypothetical protein